MNTTFYLIVWPKGPGGGDHFSDFPFNLPAVSRSPGLHRGRLLCWSLSHVLMWLWVCSRNFTRETSFQSYCIKGPYSQHSLRPLELVLTPGRGCVCERSAVHITSACRRAVLSGASYQVQLTLGSVFMVHLRKEAASVEITRNSARDIL